MANAEQSAEFNPNLATRMDHVDAWCDKWSDRLNPILVKETRQALKSRQFVVTFSAVCGSWLDVHWDLLVDAEDLRHAFGAKNADRLLLCSGAAHVARRPVGSLPIAGR